MNKLLLSLIVLISVLLPAGSHAQIPVAGGSCVSGQNAVDPNGVALQCRQVSGVYQWVAVGGSSTAAGYPASVADPTLFGATHNTQKVCDATITNTSNVVATAAGDPPFAATDVGKVMWGSNAQCGGENIVSDTIIIAKGTITGFTDAHHVTVSNNATANCTVVNADNCVFVWGTDDTTAMNNAWAVATNQCLPLVMPAGGIMVSAPITNQSASGCPLSIAGNGSPNTIEVFGQGPTATTLYFTPDYGFAFPMFSTNNTSGISFDIHHMGFSSFSPAVGGNSTSFLKLGFWSSLHDTFWNRLFPQVGSSFTCVTAFGVGNANVHVYQNIFIGACGTTLAAQNGVYFHHNSVQNVVRCISVAGASGNFKSLVMHDNFLTLCGTQSAISGSQPNTNVESSNDHIDAVGTTLPVIALSGGGIYNFHNDVISGAQTTGATLNIGAGVTVNIDGEQNIVQTTSGTANAITNAGTLTLRNTTVTSSGGTGLSNSGTVTVKDGNTLNNAVTNTGTIQGQPGQGTWQGACTGVVTSATTVGLYGLGQQTATTCTSTTVASGQVMTKAGTVYALYCTATAGNQATDACTVVKNGAAQTMTCSLNAVATCTDGAVAHAVTYVQGDILGIEVIGGTATTLANVKGTLVTN